MNTGTVTLIHAIHNYVNDSRFIKRSVLITIKRCVFRYDSMTAAKILRLRLPSSMLQVSQPLVTLSWKIRMNDVGTAGRASGL